MGGGQQRRQRNVKNGGFSLFTSTLHTRRVDSSVMMWIKIRARGGGGGGSGGMLPRNFCIKMVRSGAFWVF